MLRSIDEQIAIIVKDHIKTAPMELEAFIAYQSGTWDAIDVISDEQAEDGVTALCLDVAKTILREFIILEREDESEEDYEDMFDA